MNLKVEFMSVMVSAVTPFSLPAVAGVGTDTLYYVYTGIALDAHLMDCFL